MTRQIQFVKHVNIYTQISAKSIVQTEKFRFAFVNYSLNNVNYQLNVLQIKYIVNESSSSQATGFESIQFPQTKPVALDDDESLTCI